MAKFGEVALLSGANAVKFRAASGLAADYVLLFPSTAPGNDQVLKWNTATSAFVWGAAGGSVSSDTAALTVTGTTNFVLSFPSTAANRFLASPSGGVGLPVFRAIADADIASLDASKLTGTVAAAQLPAGTNASTWQIGVATSNVKLVADTTKLEVRDNSNALADLVVKKLTASEVDFNQVNVVAYGDSIFVLNSDYVGSTPTEDAGFEVERGTLTNFAVNFQESTDRLVAGFVGTLRKVALIIDRTFTSASLTGNNLVWAHGLNSPNPVSINVYNSSGEQIIVTHTKTDDNTSTVDLTGLTITGTWSATLIG